MKLTAWTCLVMLLAVVSPNNSGASGVPQPIGCYQDKVSVLQRALPYVQLIDKKKMTLRMCAAECAGRGFPFVGLEYGNECYCGKAKPTTKLLDKSSCSMPCAGDESATCGGPLALSVFKVHALRPKMDRCLLSLVMILKDEAHTILSTLKTVKPYVDRWFILDTGSTDGTQEKVKSYMSSIKGKLFEEPFVDYGATRNRILDLALQTEPCVFTLMLSADERVTNGGDMRAFLSDMRNAAGPQHGAYPVIMNSGVDFDSVRIARTDSRWRYVGRVHEYLTSPQKGWVDLYRPKPEIKVLFSATDGDRRFKSQFKILDILLDDLKRNVNDTRSMFYIARTYSTVGNHSAAAHYYEMLAARSKWDEEVYHALVMRGLEMKAMRLPWREWHAVLTDAYMKMPDHMDAIHLMAEDHFNSGRFPLAYMYALQAASIPKPKGLEKAQNILLRDTSHLYQYEGKRLLGVAAERVRQYAVCAAALAAVVQVRPSDSYAGRLLYSCKEKAKQTPSGTMTAFSLPCGGNADSNARQSHSSEAVQRPRVNGDDHTNSMRPHLRFVGRKKRPSSGRLPVVEPLARVPPRKSADSVGSVPVAGDDIVVHSAQDHSVVHMWVQGMSSALLFLSGMGLVVAYYACCSRFCASPRGRRVAKAGLSVGAGNDVAVTVRQDSSVRGAGFATLWSRMWARGRTD